MTDSPQTELHWYVAKTFRRERKIKERLEILGIEHFIPFHKVVKQFGARRVAVEEPIVNGIIFIRYDFRGSIALVNDYGFEMRYLRNRETRSLLVVPDKQMEDFIFLLSHCEDQIEFVSPDLRPGDRVRVTSRRGSLETTASVSDKTNPGQTWMPFHFQDGNSNWLTIAALDPVSKAPEYKVCAVRVEKA